MATRVLPECLAESRRHIRIFVVPSGLKRHVRVLVVGTSEKQVDGPYLDCQQTLAWLVSGRHLERSHRGRHRRLTPGCTCETSIGRSRDAGAVTAVTCDVTSKSPVALV